MENILIFSIEYYSVITLAHNSVPFFYAYKITFLNKKPKKSLHL